MWFLINLFVCRIVYLGMFGVVKWFLENEGFVFKRFFVENLVCVYYEILEFFYYLVL